MEKIVNCKRIARGRRGSLPVFKEASVLMAARVPVPVAEAIEARRRQSGQSKTDLILEALEAFFSTKK